MTDFELGWLAGLMDGEGCITMTRNNGKNLMPMVQVTNTNLDLMEKAKEIMELLAGREINIHSQNMRGKRGYRNCYYIAVRNQLGVSRILTALLPHLVAKKVQAELVLEFVNSRIATPRRSRFGARGGQHRPYSDYELELLEQVQHLNKYSHRREQWGSHPNP